MEDSGSPPYSVRRELNIMIVRLYLIVGRMSQIINNFAKLLLAVFLGIMTAFTVAQVFCRYILYHPLTWPEELNVFLMSWLTFVGSSIAIKENSHIGVEMFLNLLPSRFALLVKISNQFLIALCAFLITKYGFNVAMVNKNVYSDALGISMFLPRASLVVGGFMMLFQVFYTLLSNYVNVIKECCKKERKS